MFNLGHAHGHELEHQALAQLLLKNNSSSGLWANRPAAPVDGQRFFATDSTRRIEYEWDNTAGQWLSTVEYTTSIPGTTFTGTSNTQFQLPRDSSLYIERLDLTIAQVNAGSGVNFWSWATGTGLSISGGTVDTKLQGAGANVAYAYTSFTGNPVILAANTIGRLLMTFTQNNVGAGNASFWATLTYRKVG